MKPGLFRKTLFWILRAMPSISFLMKKTGFLDCRHFWTSSYEWNRSLCQKYGVFTSFYFFLSIYKLKIDCNKKYGENETLIVLISLLWTENPFKRKIRVFYPVCKSVASGKSARLPGGVSLQRWTISLLFLSWKEKSVHSDKTIKVPSAWVTSEWRREVVSEVWIAFLPLRRFNSTKQMRIWIVFEKKTRRCVIGWWRKEP